MDSATARIASTSLSEELKDSIPMRVGSNIQHNSSHVNHVRLFAVSCLLALSFPHQNQQLCHAFMERTSTTCRMRRRYFPYRNQFQKSFDLSPLSMVSVQDTWSNIGKKIELGSESFDNDNQSKRNRVRKKYQRKRIPETERERRRLSRERQQQYEQLMKNNADGSPPSIWSFESLFPKAVLDEEMIEQDLYGISRRDQKMLQNKASRQNSVDNDRNDKSDSNIKSKLKTSAIGASSMMRIWREPKLSSFVLPYDAPDDGDDEEKLDRLPSTTDLSDDQAKARIFESSSISNNTTAGSVGTNTSGRVDFAMTRMVEDRIFGYRRGTGLYDTSLMGDGAVQFREGVRLGNPLRINADLLNYYAKKELRANRLEEAQELYEEAIRIDSRDGRAYLGLSKCAERRRDFKLAREFLRMGIAESVSCSPDGTPDTGANPFLLQTLGCLEEKAGRLAEAESLYISAVRSRPSHAASWISLAQLRTRKFRQGAAAGRVCYQSAEKELQKAGLPASAWVYTAWASMEYKKCGEIRRARQLYKAALTADKKCSAAWLQLGVMEAENENWKEAELCFETVLKFDQQNSRVLQAYAVMESKRPEVNTRKVIGLFERALKANPKDAGVLQPYALFVANLGDIDSARDLLRRGTEAKKRHSPVWQAWGVLETRTGNPEHARSIFQQGIWACAQLTGGQSGGYTCARLWQAWGVLEASEGEYAAARRCFSRALDADNRNIAAMVAWTLMEEELGNIDDARHLLESSLQKFDPGTVERKQLWRVYELMEQRIGNEAGVQEVYHRSMRESFAVAKEEQGVDDIPGKDVTTIETAEAKPQELDIAQREVEVVRWDQGSSSLKAEIWLTDGGDIEGMVPARTMQKKKKFVPSSTIKTASQKRNI